MMEIRISPSCILFQGFKMDQVSSSPTLKIIDAASHAVVQDVIQVPFKAKAVPFKTLLGRFRKEKGGIAAVEFGMIAMPFFGLLFSIFETATDFYINATLQTAVTAAARDILTGQAQTANYSSASDFISKALCGGGTIARRVPSFMNCNRIKVDVRPAAAFAGMDMSKPVHSGALDTSSWSYDPGKNNDLIVVRAIYTVPIVTSIFGTANTVIVSGSSWPQRVLLATAAFKNEP